MSIRLQTPFHVALIINLIISALLAIFAALAAFASINNAVERTLKQEIRHDIEVLQFRAPERASLPGIASITVNIGRRVFKENQGDSYSIYLLAREDRSIIVGNATMWPNVTLGQVQWAHIDGEELGLDPGTILIRTEVVDGGIGLIVGRRLTARQALVSHFLPALVFGFILLSVSGGALLMWLHFRYKNRIQAYNTVFSAVGAGDLSARIQATIIDHPGDELSKLGYNINGALNEVQRLLSSLDSYSQVAAHELNLAVSHMRDRFIELEDAHSVEEADRMLELVSHILELAKIESTPGFAMQRVPLRDVVEAVITLFHDAFEDKEVGLHFEFDPEEMNVLCSRLLIESAVTNLLSNAFKHSPTGTNVMVTLRQGQRQLILSIQDEGPGVADTNIDALAQLGRQSQSEGNGFGLRHVQAVAIRHGARFTLDNTFPGLRATLSFSHIIVEPPSRISKRITAPHA